MPTLKDILNSAETALGDTAQVAYEAAKVRLYPFTRTGIAEDRVKQLIELRDWEYEKVDGLFLPEARSVVRDGLRISVTFGAGIIAVEECVALPHVYEDFTQLAVAPDGQATYTVGTHTFREAFTVPFDPRIGDHRRFAKTALAHANLLYSL